MPAWTGGDGMRTPYPCLITNAVLNATVRVVADGDIDGSSDSCVLYDGRANYAEMPRRVTDTDRRAVDVRAVVLIPGDIVEGRERVIGTVYVDGGATGYVIDSCARMRNPDGTVNYTRLELI